MRKDLLNAGAEKQHYEIRAIVDVAEKFASMGIPITWENIGDPVTKGEKLPEWMKHIIKSALDHDEAYGYCPTRGVERTREFLAELTNQRGGAHVNPEDVLFFNGVGDSISKVYSLLSPSVRVIGPSPAYSTHSSAEAAHAASDTITYPLDPENKWHPDLKELRNNLTYVKDISGILVINPNNPTGAVYPREVLEEIVDLAEEFDQFLIFDEIYMNLTYNGEPAVPLSDIIRGVPGMSMKGISKEWPWPGARSGWVESYNLSGDSAFRDYTKQILEKKRLEVCSTTHPQMVIPDVMGDPRYREHISQRNENFRQRAQKAADILGGIDDIIAHKAEGAFYMTVMFREGVLNQDQRLCIDNSKTRDYVEKITEGTANDTRFVYNLLGATGICVVPLTSFDCPHEGFRITLLETDDEKFEWTFNTIKNRIIEYVDS